MSERVFSRRSVLGSTTIRRCPREAVYTPFSVTRVDGLSLIAVSPKVGVSYE